jgi:hypothetical protein
MFRTQIFKMIRNQLCHDFSTVREAPVLFEYKGKGVKVILNNPKKLNALDLDMISLIRPEVDKWNRENKVKVSLNSIKSQLLVCCFHWSWRKGFLCRWRHKEPLRRQTRLIQSLCSLKIL